MSAKDLLCHAPILKAPDFHRPFKLHGDVCSFGAGAVLLQEDNMSVDHPVRYFSKKFTKCQNNYSTIEKEALALMLALQHFEVYLGGSSVPIGVFTDHNPLTFLFRMCNANPRLMRLALIVQYNLYIKHQKGTDNVVADALSRVMCELWRTIDVFPEREYRKMYWWGCYVKWHINICLYLYKECYWCLYCCSSPPLTPLF